MTSIYLNAVSKTKRNGTVLPLSEKLLKFFVLKLKKKEERKKKKERKKRKNLIV